MRRVMTTLSTGLGRRGQCIAIPSPDRRGAIQNELSSGFPSLAGDVKICLFWRLSHHFYHHEDLCSEI